MNKYSTRINVIGTSGSGKTVFSEMLSKTLSLPHIEMDALFWQENWTPLDNEIFFSRLQLALSENRWILDGNYSEASNIKWHDVQTIIWIDYSFLRTLYQALKRIIIKSISKQELWQGTGNKESFKRAFFSRHSILLKTISNYREKRTRYTLMMNDPQYAHIEFIRLRSPEKSKLFIHCLQLLA